MPEVFQEDQPFSTFSSFRSKFFFYLTARGAETIYTRVETTNVYINVINYSIVYDISCSVSH